MADDFDIPQQNPRGFDVGAVSPLGSVPGPQPTPPNLSTPQQAPAAPQVNPAQAADVAHHYSLGRAVKSLFGQERNYSVDDTGNMVESDNEAKPGQIFRHMLAGVLLGGAAAEKNKSSNFLGGLVSGGAASMDDSRSRDSLKRKQAQEDFKQRLEANKDRREETYASTQQDLMKAQIAMHNAQTMRENQLIQRENYEAHERTAAHGKAQLQPFIDANMPKAFDGVSESEMGELLKKNPNAGNLLWEPTGTTIKIDQDGKPHEELTYSAVDPKGKVKVTSTQIDNWKKAGLDQIYGKQFFDVLKDGKELDAQQYMALTHAEQDFHNKDVERKKQNLDARKEEAQITLERAQAAHFLAESKKLARDNKKDTDYDSALEEFNDPKKAGGDFSKLSPKAQFILGDHVTKEADEIQRMMGTLVNAGQVEEAKKLYPKWEMLTNIKTGLVQQSQPQGQKPSGENEAVKNIGEVMQQDNVGLNSTDAFEYINKTGLSAADKAAAIKQYAVVPWSLIEERAKQEGITRNKMAAKMKNQGFKLEFSSDEEADKAAEKAFPHP